MADHASVEDLKRASRRLRGTLLESLADPVTGALREGDQTLLKYHGSYQQDDRDLREERRRQKLEPAWQFMIRTRTPGGVLTPAQWLGLDGVASRFAERGLRITTRQAIQFHGVIKRELKPTLQAINAALIDTIAACGDVNRNVTVGVNPDETPLHAAVWAQAAALSEHLLPRTRAYHEIWLDGEKLADSGEEAEPLYGDTYLPRKFKTGFALPPYNDIDVFAQDLGFIAIAERGELRGYDVVAGGGMGATHGDAATYPRLARMLGFIAPEHAIAVAAAVLTVQRDWGDRVQRKRARLKYTIETHGLDAFRAEVERRAGVRFAPPAPFRFIHNGDRFGWAPGADGRLHLTVRILSGRVRDDAGARVQSGLRAIAALLDAQADGAQLRLTPNQNLTIANVPARLRDAVDARVAEHGLDRAGGTPLRQAALACVALPTCALAMAEAERYLPRAVARIDALLDRHGLSESPLHLRISGCPNGCSRPYLGEIALVGKAPGRYNLMLGADHRGQRLNALHLENADEDAILAALDSLFARYARERAPGERFGDFVVRAGVAAARETVEFPFA
ncbi:assimilatory sulfite reductase (NADPH) hemoprotein subunit [Vulcaniibacterium thermophilum]|uniref:Sulfite reductase [NADPH] hemoprotein beta-component n=1 Tax=Vulcaniibacterium thermophilum TaxID=1169913 RepID=A0A919DAM5_9GAMM|nr:assimilatory sulfite reductase (NADPH) hemoprotein subunit [Vulcaniibacterium thermophilum]GHE29538.1 sulfite reductase [NADPH] hemoprotein beta-component [Vulcaniibacterium thermophilum]